MPLGLNRPAFRILAAILLALTVGVLAVSFAARDRSLARVRAAGVLRVGYAIEAPYAFLSPRGEVTGESPEIARAIAARLGIPRVTWRLANFSALLDELAAGNIDLVAAGMAITPERLQRARFTVPTLIGQPAFLVHRGNPRRLLSYPALRGQPGVRLVVLAGSLEESRLRELALPADTLASAPDVLTARRLVETGRADALALTAPTLRWMLRTEPSADLEIVELPIDRYAEPMLAAQAFRRSDRALCEAWNAELQRFLGSPGHLALLAAFGLSARDLPLAARPPPPGGSPP